MTAAPSCIDLTRELLDPDTFTFQYDNLEYAAGRDETFLCYEVKKRRSGRGKGAKPFFGHLSNEPRETHAEELFFREVELLPGVNYSVTWYISWSPCADCSWSIVDYVRENPNLRLRIYVSRLYYSDDEDNREGLRDLRDAGVEITAMRRQDFEYCWQRFVDHNFTDFQDWDDLDQNSERVENELEDILEEDVPED